MQTQRKPSAASGVSIIRSGGEANKVILRGMSDKFTSFTIDGVRIPPPMPTRAALTSARSHRDLSGVELFKALTPDKDADAIAEHQSRDAEAHRSGRSGSMRNPCIAS